MGKKISLAVFGLLMAAGVAVWGLQIREGLVLTDMHNGYSWGLYISALAFLWAMPPAVWWSAP
nr:hypothetical protein [Desulfobacula sp.]